MEKTNQKLPFRQEFGWVSKRSNFSLQKRIDHWSLIIFFRVGNNLYLIPTPSQVANARVLAFFSLLFFFGVEWGTEQTFYFVYANEQLGAPVSLLGIMGAANPVTSLVM